MLCIMEVVFFPVLVTHAVQILKKRGEIGLMDIQLTTAILLMGFPLPFLFSSPNKAIPN